MLRQIFVLSCTVFLLASTVLGSNAARIKFLIGKVRILHAQETTWKDARINQDIFTGDRIQTNLSSRLELQMPDESIIKINENTIFDVKTIKTVEDDNLDRMSFTLFAGSIWAKFKKLVNTRQSRQIESPSAVVAIRGTTLEMDVNQNNRTVVRVIEGKVAVSSKNVQGEVLVGTNQESIVEEGKAPTPASTISRSGSEQGAASDTELDLKVKPEKLQYTDPAVLVAGIAVGGSVTAGATLTANGVPMQINPNGVFRGRVRIQEGLNVIRFAARLGQKSTSQTLRVLVNTRRPEIRLSSPLVAGYINRRDYSLSGAVFDGTPGEKLKVFINNNLVTELPGQGSFNRTIILNEGKNAIRVAAVDFSKNSTEITEQIFLDTVKPILTVTEPAQPVFVRLEPPRPPANDYTFKNEKFSQIIRGLVIDPAPSSGIKRIVVNGKEIQPKSDGSFETEIVVVRGVTGQTNETRLSFYIEDMAGNITRDNSRVIMVR